MSEYQGSLFHSSFPVLKKAARSCFFLFSFAIWTFFSGRSSAGRIHSFTLEQSVYCKGKEWRTKPNDPTVANYKIIDLGSLEWISSSILWVSPHHSSAHAILFYHHHWNCWHCVLMCSYDALQLIISEMGVQRKLIFWCFF